MSAGAVGAAPVGIAPVGIAMATHDGERHLDEQLDSIAAQTVPVALHAVDDASRDGTVALLRAHPIGADVRAERVNRGFVASFEAALGRALEAGHDWIALADQDDVWDADKLERALTLGHESAARAGDRTPILVHSDLRVVDASGAPLHASYLALRGYGIDDSPSLARVLGENGVMGNTVLVNRALARRALPFPPGLHLHDWWLAMVAELEGVRRLVPGPTISYRVHAANASNSAASFAARRGRARLAGLAGKLRARDFKLPYLEDGRVATVRRLLDDGSRFAPLAPGARDALETFDAYARLEGPRAALLARVHRAGLARSAPAARARAALALLATRRYDGRA